MKRILVVLMALMISSAAVALAGDDAAKAKEAKAAPTTLTGEVVDLYCYMQHPETAVGTDHAKCATACIGKGMPVGFLTSDGTLYVITGKDHEPANTVVTEWIGKKSMVTGHVKEAKGMKSIELVSIGEAKS